MKFVVRVNGISPGRVSHSDENKFKSKGLTLVHGMFTREIPGKCQIFTGQHVDYIIFTNFDDLKMSFDLDLEVQVCQDLWVKVEHLEKTLKLKAFW